MSITRAIRARVAAVDLGQRVLESMARAPSTPTAGWELMIVKDARLQDLEQGPLRKTVGIVRRCRWFHSQARGKPPNLVLRGEVEHRCLCDAKRRMPSPHDLFQPLKDIWCK